MQLIIFQGASATGKTALALRLAEDLDCPIFMKDSYKEKRYDQLGKKPSLRQWVQIENDSWQALYDKIGEATKAGGTLIVEGNFLAKRRKELLKHLTAGVTVIEIYCYAHGWLPYTRFTKRYRSGERHQGHLDHLWSNKVWQETLASQMGLRTYKPLRLSANVLEVDTTDFARVDYKRILDFVSAHTSKRTSP